MVPLMVLVMSHQRVHCLGAQLKRPVEGPDSCIFEALLGDSTLNPSDGSPDGSNGGPLEGALLGASLEEILQMVS